MHSFGGMPRSPLWNRTSLPLSSNTCPRKSKHNVHNKHNVGGGGLSLIACVVLGHFCFAPSVVGCIFVLFHKSLDLDLAFSILSYLGVQNPFYQQCLWDRIWQYFARIFRDLVEGQVQTTRKPYTTLLRSSPHTKNKRQKQ